MNRPGFLNEVRFLHRPAGFRLCRGRAAYSFNRIALIHGFA